MSSSRNDVIDKTQMRESESPSKVKVVIIGAGIAGVTAAATLYHNGIKDLVVLEAQDYIGGRIKAEVVDGKNIDLGAQFIHGQVGNPLFPIAEALGIIVDEDIEEIGKTATGVIPTLHTAGHFRLCSNGQQAIGEEISRCQKIVEEVYNSTDPTTLDDETTVGDIYTKAYDDYLREHGADLSSTTKHLVDAAFRSLWTSTNIDNASDDLNELSGWAGLMYDELEGKRFLTLRGGMTLVLKAILSLLPEEIIHTNSPVTGIKWDRGDGIESVDTVAVVCENGKSFEADHVIVTISSGCLMNGLEMFEPPLPSSFTNSLRGLKLGVTGKIYLEWESPFWNRDALLAKMEEDEVVDFLWLESCPVKIKSDTSKKLTRSGKPWWYGLGGFDLLASHNNLLEFWFTGDQVQVLEQLSNDEVTSVLHELLQVFFDNPDIPKPVGIYRSRWLGNPYVGGSYTYPTKSLHRSDVDVLSNPIFPSVEKPRILFAGEAFSLGTIGTAHGAYLSGENRAGVILKAMRPGMSQCKSILGLIQKGHYVH